MAFLEEFKDLKIQLEEIKSATNNFGKDKLIGAGGFGLVYKGEMPAHFKKQGLVAFKRLNDKYGQGEAEFSKEITTLSNYKHENLISLLGFCNEGPEKILVYEYASNGSLDQHLSSATLTWRQRLKICLQAARALEYLHDPRGGHQRVLHCDIKSGNILLDDAWNAKLSDLGLSKMGPANQAQTFLISSAVGTLGYCDPLYMVKGFLTKESDVYSFGVLLFEVLCGRLCYQDINGQVQLLVPLWKESYEQQKLEETIVQDMDHNAFLIFSHTAYQCLKTSREERPTMTQVVNELEDALKSQEISEGKEDIVVYEEMIRNAEPPVKYKSKTDLMILLSRGVLLNGGTTWFSLTKTGGHCELISIGACLTTTSNEDSKFAVGCYYTENGRFKVRVRTQFLSPSITYTVNLVFRFYEKGLNAKKKFLGVKYKLVEESKTSVAYQVDAREDGWLSLELYQFTCDRSIVNLDILFGGTVDTWKYTYIEGIEFRPVEMEHKVSDDGKREEQTIPYDASWEEKLPAEYEDIIKCSKDGVQWTTKEELYSILCNGFLLNDGQEWFYLHKRGKRCLMLSATAAISFPSTTRYLSLPGSRFGEAFDRLTHQWFAIEYKIKSEMLSSETRYASYLVYKLLQEDQSRFYAPVEVKEKNTDDFAEPADPWYIHLVSPQTPVIRPMDGENTHNPLSRPKLKDLPQQRNDGWLEVKVWEFVTGTTTQAIPMSLQFSDFSSTNSTSFEGMILQGFELRPI